VFLHPVRYVGPVVHSGATVAQNIDALFFMMGWDWHGLQEKHTGTTYVELVFLYLVQSVGHVVHYGASGV
jgi:hypothetical protein